MFASITRPPGNSSLELWAYRELSLLANPALSGNLAFESSAFLSKNSIVNRQKYEGLSVWDSTIKKPLWASGKATTSPWVDATGTVVYTPV